VKRADRGRSPRTSLLAVVLALAAVLLVAGFGVSTVRDRHARTLVLEGDVDGLAIELSRARWIENQMDHGGAFPVPTSMMPDLPDHETHQRLTVDLSFFNRADAARRVDLDDFRLESDAGLDLVPRGGYAGDQVLSPGQVFLNALSFDYPLDHDAGELRLVWRPQGRELHMPIPPLPDHRHFEEVLGIEWPLRVAELQRVGRASKGLQLYAEKYGCAACHGQPENPGSQTIGPSLAGLAAEAARRIAGKSAEQYVYESLLSPDAHIAPTCGAEASPCTDPSAMPPYGDLLSREDMAHLVAYLLEREATSV